MQLVTKILGLCFLVSIGQAVGERVRYDNYKLYKVVPSDVSQLDVLKQMETYSDSLIFLQELVVPKRDIGVVVSPHKVHDFEESVKRNEIQYELVENNFQTILDEEIAENEASSTKKSSDIEEDDWDYDWTSYRTLEETYEWIANLTRRFPNVVLPLDAGVSYERRRILGFKISMDKGRTEKPGIFIESGIHAREWIAPATITYIANQLLRSEDPVIRELAAKYDWYIIPHANPDGFAYTHSTNRMWRKTRSPQSGNCYGTDPNRNWDFHWAEAGTSSNPCSESYAGSYAASEIETVSLSRYIASLKGKLHLYLAFHSYSQFLLYPYGYTAAKPPNDDDFAQVFNVTVDAISQRYGTKYTGGNIYEAIYPAAGSSMEWAYGVQDIQMAFTYELRPTGTSLIGFRLQANKIIPSGEETLDSLVAMINEVDKLGYFKL